MATLNHGNSHFGAVVRDAKLAVAAVGLCAASCVSDRELPAPASSLGPDGSLASSTAYVNYSFGTCSQLYQVSKKGFPLPHHLDLRVERYDLDLAKDLLSVLGTSQVFRMSVQEGVPGSQRIAVMGIMHAEYDGKGSLIPIHDKELEEIYIAQQQALFRTLCAERPDIIFVEVPMRDLRILSGEPHHADFRKRALSALGAGLSAENLSPEVAQIFLEPLGACRLYQAMRSDVSICSMYTDVQYDLIREGLDYTDMRAIKGFRNEVDRLASMVIRDYVSQNPQQRVFVVSGYAHDVASALAAYVPKELQIDFFACPGQVFSAAPYRSKMIEAIGYDTAEREALQAKWLRSVPYLYPDTFEYMAESVQKTALELGRIGDPDLSDTEIRSMLAKSAKSDEVRGMVGSATIFVSGGAPRSGS